MAINAEQLNIILAAKDAQFVKAMDANARRVERFAKTSKAGLGSTSKSFDVLGMAASKMGVVLGAVSVGAMVSMAKNVMETAKQIENMSRLSGVGIEQFQLYAFAANKFGVGQEKLSDILKDVNDKFGDYAATGGGPLADFFENIAPKIGITADAFKDLSSADKMGLYIKSLEDAGVNQSELTFYMEALASDATALAPLFTNNASAMNAMSVEAAKLGIVIDEDLIKRSSKMNDVWDAMVGSMQAKWIAFASTVLTGMDNMFGFTMEGQIAGLQSRLSALGEEAKNFKQGLANELGIKVEDITPDMVGESTNAGAYLSDVMADMEMANVQLAELMEARAALQAAADRQAELGGSGTGGTKDATKTAENAKKSYDSLKSSIDANYGAAIKYEAALTTVNEALSLGIITEAQAAETIAQVKQQMDLAIGAAVDLSSVFTTMESGMTSAFMSMVDGTMTAKDAFRSMAVDIIKELYRVLFVQQLVGSFNTATGTGSGIVGAIGGALSGKAAGGPVQAGVPTIAGEHGRELFVPQSNGRIMTVAQTKQMQGGGGGGVVVNQTINVTTGVQQTVRAEIKSLMPQIADNAKAAVLDAKRRGGSYGGGFA